MAARKQRRATASAARKTKTSTTKRKVKSPERKTVDGSDAEILDQMRTDVIIAKAEAFESIYSAEKAKQLAIGKVVAAVKRGNDTLDLMRSKYAAGEKGADGKPLWAFDWVSKEFATAANGSSEAGDVVLSE